MKKNGSKNGRHRGDHSIHREKGGEKEATLGEMEEDRIGEWDRNKFE